MKEEVYLWILGRPKIILTKMKDQSVLIVIHINIWQRNAKGQEKKEKQGSTTSTTKQNTLQRTEVFKKNQMKKAMINKRVLSEVWNKYNTTKFCI